MTNIQENIDQILVLFDKAADAEGCSYVDVDEIIEMMNEDIALLADEYEGILLGGVVNPLFKTLDIASIVCGYVKHYTNNVIVYSSLMEQEHIIFATEMTEIADAIGDKIKKLNKKMQNKRM